MQVTITAQDNISSALARMVDGAGRQGLMEAIGQAVVSQTKLAFDNAGQRPAPWPARTTGGSHALLKLSLLENEPRYGPAQQKEPPSGDPARHRVLRYSWGGFVDTALDNNRTK